MFKFAPKSFIQIYSLSTGRLSSSLLSVALSPLSYVFLQTTTPIYRLPSTHLYCLEARKSTSKSDFGSASRNPSLFSTFGCMSLVDTRVFNITSTQ